MGNDLLMARVEFAPMLEGHVSCHFLVILDASHRFILTGSTPLTNGTMPQPALALSTLK